MLVLRNKNGSFVVYLDRSRPVLCWSAKPLGKLKKKKKKKVLVSFSSRSLAHGLQDCLDSKKHLQTNLSKCDFQRQNVACKLCIRSHFHHVLITFQLFHPLMFDQPCLYEKFNDRFHSNKECGGKTINLLQADKHLLPVGEFFPGKGDLLLRCAQVIRVINLFVFAV